MLASANTLAAEPRYHNPSPMVQVIGYANEVAVVVKGVEITALVDTGSHISALTKVFCTEFGLRILPLRGLLHLKGMGGFPIPYEEYIEANLPIPGLPRYNEDVLLFLVSNHKYGQREPVQIGIQVIDHLVATMTEKELQQLWIPGNRYTSALQFPTGNTVKGLNIPAYDLEGIKGKICTVREVIILPFVTAIVKDIANLMHSKCINEVVEPVMGYSDHIATPRYYGVLKPGRGKIDFCLRNHSAKQITLPKETAVGENTP